MLKLFRSLVIGDKQQNRSGLHLLDLPNELIALILSNVDPVHLLRKCTRVCSRFNDIISAPDFWSDLFEKKYGREDLHLLRSQLPDHQIDFKRIVAFLSFGRNLILNASGEEKTTEYWDVTADGGNRMIVESADDTTSAPGAGVKMTKEELLAIERPSWLEVPSKYCFSTSFGLGEKVQTVNLMEVGFQSEILDIVKPPIAVGEWTAARWDCGSEYHLNVHLLGESDEPLEKFSATVRVNQWDGGQWKPVWHVFTNYQTGVRKVRFQHSGVDTHFWRGHYGAKFANATVKVLFSNNAVTAEVHTPEGAQEPSAVS